MIVLYNLGQRSLLIILCLLLVLTPFYAGSSMMPADQVAPRYGGTLRIAYDSDPGSWNGFINYDSHAQYLHRQIFNKMLTYDDSYHLIGDLAKTYPVINSTADYPTIYTFQLEENIRWHDGEPLTAQDVKFTWETIAWGAQNRLDAPDPTINDRLRNPSLSAFIFRNLTKIEILDAYTLRLSFNAITLDSWLGTLGAHSNILPYHLWKDFNRHNPPGYTFEDNPYNGDPVGSGPYKLAKHVPGEYIILERNEDYFRGVPYLKYLEWYFYPDLTTATRALEKGDIDSIHEQLEIPPGRIYDLNTNEQFNEQFTVDTFPSTTTWRVTFNLHPDALERWPWLADVQVRQAMEYAIDKENFVQNVLFNSTRPIYTAIPGIVTSYSGDYNSVEHGYTGLWPIEKRIYNPIKAHQLLEEAGWTLNPDGVREKKGILLDGLRMPYYDHAYAFASADALTAYWAAIGIGVIPVPVSPSTFISAFVTSRYGLMSSFPKLEGPYPMALSMMVGGPDPAQIREWVETRKNFLWTWNSGPTNFGFYSNSSVDALFEQGASTALYIERKPYYDELQYLMHADIGYIFLWSAWTTEAWNNDFAGFGSNRPVAWYGSYYRGNDTSSNSERGVYRRDGNPEPDITTTMVSEIIDFQILMVVSSIFLAVELFQRRKRRVN